MPRSTIPAKIFAKTRIDSNFSRTKIFFRVLISTGGVLSRVSHLVIASQTTTTTSALWRSNRMSANTSLRDATPQMVITALVQYISNAVTSSDSKLRDIITRSTDGREIGAILDYIKTNAKDAFNKSDRSILIIQAAPNIADQQIANARNPLIAAFYDALIGKLEPVPPLTLAQQAWKPFTQFVENVRLGNREDDGADKHDTTLNLDLSSGKWLHSTEPRACCIISEIPDNGVVVELKTRSGGTCRAPYEVFYSKQTSSRSSVGDYKQERVSDSKEYLLKSVLSPPFSGNMWKVIAHLYKPNDSSEVSPNHVRTVLELCCLHYKLLVIAHFHGKLTGPALREANRVLHNKTIPRLLVTDGTLLSQTSASLSSSDTIANALVVSPSAASSVNSSSLLDSVSSPPSPSPSQPASPIASTSIVPRPAARIPQHRTNQDADTKRHQSTQSSCEWIAGLELADQRLVALYRMVTRSIADLRCTSDDGPPSGKLPRYRQIANLTAQQIALFSMLERKFSRTDLARI